MRSTTHSKTMWRAAGMVSSLLRNFSGRKDFRDASATFAVRVISAFLAYGVQVFLARTLRLGDYGIYVTLWTWLIVFNHVATFGFSESSLRFLPRYIHRGKEHWARAYLNTGFRVVMLGASLSAAAGLALLFLFRDAVPTAYLMPLIVVCIGLPFTSLEVYLEGVSRSFGWYMLTIVPAYILRPVLLAICVVTAIAFGFVLDAGAVLGFAIAATAGIVITQACVIRSRVAKMVADRRSIRRRRLWLIASLPLMLTLAVDEIFAWSDILILGLMVAPEQVSIYFAAQRSMSLAAFIQFAFMIVMVRDFSLAYAMRDRQALQARIARASNWTFWLTIPAVLVTLAAGYPLLWLFGPNFLDGYAIMVVLGIGFVVRASIGQVQDLMIVLGHQRANIVISSGCILLNIVLSILLIPGFGIMGAAIATAATHVARAIAFSLAAHRLAGLWVLAGLPSFDFVRATRPKTMPIKEEPVNLTGQA